MKEKTFFITYKPVGKGFADVDRMVKAENKTQAVKKLRDELNFNITIKHVS